MTNEVVRGDDVVHSSSVDVYDFEQQGGYHVPQDSFELLPGDSFRTTCYYRDGDRFGLDSDEEMCITYVMYYPVLELQDYTWVCPYTDSELITSVGCAQELEFSDIANDDNLGRTFGTPNECDAESVAPPTKTPTTQQPTTSKAPTKALRPCAFCIGGLTVDSTLEVPGADGATCGNLVSYAAFLEEGSETCSEVKGAELLCCPAKVMNPCTFCTEGLALDFDFVIPGAPNGETCGDLLNFSPTFEAESDACSQIQSAEIVCCPGVVGGTQSPGTQNETSDSPSSAPVALESTMTQDPTSNPNSNTSSAGMAIHSSLKCVFFTSVISLILCFW